MLKLGRFDEKIREVEVRSNLAKLYLERKNTEEAKKELLILTKIDASNYEHYFELGKLFFNAGVMDKAIGFFKKAVASNARHEASHFYLGQIYYRNGNHADAKQAFINTIKIEPSHYRAHYYLGLVLRQQGDQEWAIKEFETAQKSEDLKVKCFLAKGTCYSDKGQHPKAIMEFERGLKFSRKGSDTELNLRYFMAESQEKMRDIHAAIANWEKIQQSSSNFRDVNEKLSQYAEFRQDDRIKDFLIAGLSQFEHVCRKIAQSMGYRIMDIDIMSDTEIEIIVTEADAKWRNTRQVNHVMRFNRTTETIGERLLRSLHEQMKSKNANRIIFITTADFDPRAVDFANTRPIELLGKNELVGLLKKI